ncbi:cupin domain-containing protein [Lysobacter sp. KIS68-7]|uniref:cupin domain-containing protein n=1 Tax=Lysobacter sp. KIS68-7 TaxID=2904252 RepID=UPI001E5F4B16|nr:cupin domain-containing protein [Lysobacter sp. KIS68-7]UHQ18534.1 cupin domain-containing protein [Lysobacter sp. KIS68-7]
MNAFLHDALRGQLPTHLVASDDLPWVPEGEGKWAKPLRFLGDRGFVELLRMSPGTVMPLHRHTGEVHVHQLSGHRQLNTGEIVGPGDYVFEPAGNVDWWKVVGEEDMLAFAVVIGEVEFIGPGGEVRAVANVQTQRAGYEKFCAEHNLLVRQLRA